MTVGDTFGIDVAVDVGTEVDVGIGVGDAIGVAVGVGGIGVGVTRCLEGAAYEIVPKATVATANNNANMTKYTTRYIERR